MDMENKTLLQHADELRRGEYSARELCQWYLSKEDSFNAFITKDPEEAIKKAEEADRLLSKGSAPLLCGIPFGAKDNICTRGLRTTAGSNMLRDFIPPYSATVIKRLESAGAVLLGKTNMDEFAMGCTTETSAFGKTLNPIDKSLTPGGSSGGSAAAVSGGLAPFALGSDTGGSVRQPAAFCSVVGLCPTYGTLSRYGLIAFASSLDRIGIMARTSRDTAAVLSAICKRDSRDSTSVGLTMKNGATSKKGLRIGIIKELMGEGISPEAAGAVSKAAEALASLGAEICEVSLSSLEYATQAYYIISSAEASSCLARYDGVRFGTRCEGTFESMEEFYKKNRTAGFGREVKRRIMLGTFVLSEGAYESYYEKATATRQMICRDYSEAFERCHVLLSPTSPTPPRLAGLERTDPSEAYLEDICTVSQSLAGLPALSIPVREGGLPVGIQLTGPHFSEELLLDLGAALEEVLI